MAREVTNEASAFLSRAEQHSIPPAAIQLRACILRGYLVRLESRDPSIDTLASSCSELGEPDADLACSYLVTIRDLYKRHVAHFDSEYTCNLLLFNAVFEALVFTADSSQPATREAGRELYESVKQGYGFESLEGYAKGRSSYLKPGIDWARLFCHSVASHTREFEPALQV
jgi:hypothetical protein